MADGHKIDEIWHDEESYDYDRNFWLKIIFLV